MGSRRCCSPALWARWGRGGGDPGTGPRGGWPRRRRSDKAPRRYPEGVDRTRLRAAILANPALLKKIEAVIHPLVASDRDAFLADARASGAPLAVCDIPLLFETGADAWLDKVVVVSAPADIQRERVLGRPGMTAEALDAILAKQTPDTEKRARADYIVDTGQSKDHARAQVTAILAELTGG
jgi:dephospho-CoA kinase